MADAEQKEKEEIVEEKKSGEVQEEIDHDKIRKEIRELEDKKTLLLERMRVINAEKKQFRELRDKFNQESAESFNKVSDIKQKRDDTNQEIKDLKLMREGVLEELKMLIQKAKEIRGDLDPKTTTPPKHSKKLQRTIKDLEWRLQTTPNMAVEEEREIVQKLDGLVEHLNVLEESEHKAREFRDINKQIRDLKGFLDDSWERMQSLVSTSQNRHQSLTGLYTSGKGAKEEADKYHKLFIQRAEEYTALRNELKSTNDFLDQKYGFIREHQKERRKVQRAAARARSARVIDEKVKEIRTKLEGSKTKGLSMEEMRILLDRNLVNLNKKEEDNET
ncbi:MAG: hypothetical protein ACFFD4_10675 [Candidatus Odinarchaeota archaeon]